MRNKKRGNEVKGSRSITENSFEDDIVTIECEIRRRFYVCNGERMRQMLFMRPTLKLEHIGHMYLQKESLLLLQFSLVLFTVGNVAWKLAVCPISSTAIV